MAAVETLTSNSFHSTALFGKRPFFVSNDEFFPSKKASNTPDRVTFDPSKHLNFTPPSKVYTMEELGYAGNKGVSPVGVSEPFPLFSVEAIQQMRTEVLAPEVREKYEYSSDLAQSQLRGYAAE